MRKKILPILLGFALLLSMVGCGKSNTDPAVIPDYPVEVNGTKILERPTAVATLSPSMTRTLEGLGLSGRITGVSKYCTYPQSEWDYRYGRCGTAQSLSVSGVRRAAPQVVFSPAALTESQLTQLQQMDVDVVVIPPATNLDQLRQNYIDFFRVMWGETKGQEMAAEYLTWFDSRLEDIRSRAAQEESAGQATYLTTDLLIMATGDTLEQELLEALNLENAGEPHSEYVYPKALEVELNPDVVFYNGILSRDRIVSSSCYKSTKAVQSGQVYRVAAAPFECQSPDLLMALWQMGESLYPEAFTRTPAPSYDSSTPADGGDDTTGEEDPTIPEVTE